jgi:hypothetical protein
LVGLGRPCMDLGRPWWALVGPVWTLVGLGRPWWALVGLGIPRCRPWQAWRGRGTSPGTGLGIGSRTGRRMGPGTRLLRNLGTGLRTGLHVSLGAGPCAGLRTGPQSDGDHKRLRAEAGDAQPNRSGAPGPPYGGLVRPQAEQEAPAVRGKDRPSVSGTIATDAFAFG